MVKTKPKIILGIETSCDETACAIVQKERDRVTILSNIVASSAQLQAKFGGVIPEQAAREQLKSIIPVIQEALRLASLAQGKQSLDAIAVTKGPGLIGSLLVGVETAKVLATVWQKPLVPVNHLLGHFYANWLGEETPTFPAIGLLVSGGHTDLILMTGHGKYKYLGGTRDDAAGECFDKSARLLGLPYPGGPSISKLAEKGDPQAFSLPRPMIDSNDFDFSFSGLKTAIANQLSVLGCQLSDKSQSVISLSVTEKQKTGKPNSENRKQKTDNQIIADLAASIQEAITDVLVHKTFKAIQTFKVNELLVAGGVAANQTLAKKLTAYTLQKKLNVRIFIPKPNLCTDNAAYIATTAFFNYHPIRPIKLQANPNLSLFV
ncbi:MAG: tRNA (adenosine(37)-N6)-threonylcarbamoyltransferase complex transferase subunit TsaD [Candidatus Daviesbacteria bacterium]|nr:tRNA (adenosine(37)-N6)-threonylcarbamoyltransferase complex transferase subunit TsaD [Candidatus Daviesbacteria bacterium]